MKCSVCDGELEPVYEYTNNQYKDAMHLKLHPGYGEYFDGDDYVDVFMCEGCTDSLFENFPRLRDNINDELDRQAQSQEPREPNQENNMKNIIGAIILSLMTGFGTVAGCGTLTDQVVENINCEEDMPCWDCETMGNKICGPNAERNN